MNPADEMAAKLETTERRSDRAAAGSFDSLKDQLRAVFKELERPSHQSMPAEDLHGSDDELDQQLSVALDISQRPQRKPVEENEPVGRDALRFTSYLDHEASERKAIYDRLMAIEKGMKKRGSRRPGRYLTAILIGVAATLAWQSYGDAAKRIIATRAPELGSSPEAKQMIAGWMDELGWTNPPAGADTAALQARAVPVPQAAVAAAVVASNTPAAASIDPEKVQQMARDQATLRQTVEQLTAGLDHVTHEIGKLEVADDEILAKITPAPLPPRPIAAPARKPTPKVPQSSPAPVAPPTSLPPIPPPDQ
jgi:hypothetical protein